MCPKLFDDFVDPSVRSTHGYPFSLDVCSLYTSIPPQAAIQALKTKLLQHPEVKWPIQVNNICSLLEVILQNTYFSFENAIYKQVSGLPMGNSVSGILSSIYMDTIEQRSLHHLNIGLYKRYADDVFLLTTDEDEAKNIHKQLNEQDNNIKFEIELPTNKTLSLLDFTVNMETDTPAFSFYRKKARKPVFINFEAAIPKQAKIKCIENEEKRIAERCTTEEERRRNLKDFSDILRLNGYPESFITRRTSKKKRSVPHEKRRPNDFVYLQFPFLNDRIHHQVQNIFRKNDLPVRIFDRNTTLRRSLQRQTAPRECQLKNCTISDTDICYIKCCVYEMQCETCKAIYIGSTLRTLHIRVREHLTQEKSSVFQHQRFCRGNFDVTVAARARDNTSLRFKEALFIQRQQPTINHKRESEELLTLTFS